MRLKKIYFVIFGLILFILSIGLFFFGNTKKAQERVLYNGSSLLISVDGEATNTLPTTGFYRLSDYVCDNTDTVVNWNSDTYELEVSNGSFGGSVSCDLEFKSNVFPLIEAEVGSYVAYTGVGGTVGETSVACKLNGELSSATATDATEASNSCLGQNAREDLDPTNPYTHGYCFDEGFKYYTTGWRLAYVSTSGNPVIISAGSPECHIGISAASNTTYIQVANADSMKYCNRNFVDGVCNCTSTTAGRCSAASTDAWAVSNNDFNLSTAQLTGTTGGYLYTAITGATKCGGVYGLKACSYNDDMFDNGGYYYFAANNSDKKHAVYWYPIGRFVSAATKTDAAGLRPVIKLSSSVYVTGGKGTMDEPYTISINKFNINNWEEYTTSSTLNLNLFQIPSVTKMCISGSEECTNYVNPTSTYALDVSSYGDGEQSVYVYYKDKNDEVVASMSDTIVVDALPPTNSSVEINFGTSNYRTLTISSTEASHMCFSNTNIDPSECTWIDYAETYNWNLLEGDGERTVYAYFKDTNDRVAGPYTDTITCNGNCDVNYFVDAYSTSYIYMMRSDGATAKVTTSSTTPTWYTMNTQPMYKCASNARSKDGYIWCVGDDSNLYYKAKYSTASWTKLNTSDYIDVQNYSYTVYISDTSAIYLVRNDGRTNKSTTSGLVVKSSTWTYGADKEMVACTGVGDAYLTCLAKDGNHYYRASYSTTTDYLGGAVSGLTDNRTDKNTWIDIFYSGSDKYYAHLMETDGTNFYNYRIVYNSTTATTIDAWTVTPIPNLGIKVCAANGYSGHTNYCLDEDGYLYYKAYNATTWTKSGLVYK